MREVVPEVTKETVRGEEWRGRVVMSRSGAPEDLSGEPRRASIGVTNGANLESNCLVDGNDLVKNPQTLW